MPQRTNEFQQLVYLIQHQLRDRPDAVVTESKMLVDRNTGKKREADIAVEFSANGVPFILAFECRARSRKPTIEWVEQQTKKHEHLSDKLVLVANRPFTADAVDVARRHGVETIELSAATKTNWTAYIDQYIDLFFASFDFAVKEFTIECDYPVGTQPLNKDQEIAVTQGAQSATLPVAIQSLLRNPKLFGKPAMDLWYKLPLDQRKDEHTMSMATAPPPDNPWILTQGERSYRLTKLSITVSAKIGSAPLILGASQYEGYADCAWHNDRRQGQHGWADRPSRNDRARGRAAEGGHRGHRRRCISGKAGAHR